MVEVWATVALAVSVFSLTVRYTLWFKITNLWYSTLAAGVLQSWCLVSMAVCGLDITSVGILVGAMLLALMRHSQLAIVTTALFGAYFLLVAADWEDRVCSAINVTASVLIGLTAGIGVVMTFAESLAGVARGLWHKSPSAPPLV